MRIVRAVVLAIIATLALLGGTTSFADANPGSNAAIAPHGGYANADPGDPGFPPDD